MLESALRPCVSAAQVASRLVLSSPCLGILVGFAVLHLVGLLDFLVPIGPAVKFGDGMLAVIVGLEISMFICLLFMLGPVLSAFVMVLFWNSLNEDIDANLPYVVITCLAWYSIIALAYQVLVRNELRRRVGLPRDGIFTPEFSQSQQRNRAGTIVHGWQCVFKPGCHLSGLFRGIKTLFAECPTG